MRFLRDDLNREIHMSSAFWLAAGTASLLLAACRPPAPSDRAADASRGESRGPANQETTTTPQEEPAPVPPADVSHGEAPIGGPQADPAPRVARLAPAERTRLHRIRLEIHHTPVTIAQDVRYAAWTFGGTVPGPALHVRQGDTVDFTLVNRASIPHSMDFHAAEIAPSKYYVNVLPSDSLRYRFVARVPSAFEFYMTPKPAADGTRGLDWEKLLSLAPDHIVFNGRAGQYSAHPIDVSPNQLLRLYVVNAGPNRISSFHVVGGIFERVFQDGSQASPLAGVQTVNVPVGGGSIFEVRLREPGDYPFASHAFADATKGAVGVLRALPPGARPSAQAGAMAH